MTLDGITVEIQIRTEMQDLWAQCFERLADTWGRAIRYGGDPIEPDAPTDPALQLRGISAAATRRQTCDALRGPLSDFIDELESVQADIERSLETEAVAEAHQHLENLKHRRDSVEASLREDLKTWRHVVEEIR